HSRGALASRRRPARAPTCLGVEIKEVLVRPPGGAVPLVGSPDAGREAGHGRGGARLVRASAGAAGLAWITAAERTARAAAEEGGIDDTGDATVLLEDERWHRHGGGRRAGVHGGALPVPGHGAVEGLAGGAAGAGRGPGGHLLGLVADGSRRRARARRTHRRG